MEKSVVFEEFKKYLQEKFQKKNCIPEKEITPLCSAPLNDREFDDWRKKK